MTGSEALRDAVAALREAGVGGPARDARLLLAEALGVAPGRLALMLDEPLDPEAVDSFANMVAARVARRPLAQIVGRRAFWGRDFEVTGAVLDPRPETEALVALALAGLAPGRLLDLGTGSGILAVTLLAEWPGARGVAVDISEPALAVAGRNAARHGVAGRLELRRSDWGAAVEGIFDLVVANPPYIAAGALAGLAPEVRDWEPAAALSPGPSGLEAYARIAGELPRLVAPGGRALLEIGADQGEAVSAIMRGAGFGAVAVHPDLDGRDRVVEAAR